MALTYAKEKANHINGRKTLHNSSILKAWQKRRVRMAEAAPASSGELPHPDAFLSVMPDNRRVAQGQNLAAGTASTLKPSGNYGQA